MQRGTVRETVRDTIKGTVQDTVIVIMARILVFFEMTADLMTIFGCNDVTIII